MVDKSSEHLYKIILIGDVSVGKTCLLSRYLKNQLPKTQGPTIGVEFATKNVTMKDGATVKAQLWDTAGQEKYRAITVAHYRKALGCLIVYDITNRKTFQNLKYWLTTLLDSAEQDICIMLVGNKLDLVEEDPRSRQVSQQEAVAAVCLVQQVDDVHGDVDGDERARAECISGLAVGDLRAAPSQPPEFSARRSQDQQVRATRAVAVLVRRLWLVSKHADAQVDR
eukprot:CAMPEP_0185571182 /NCGR_PEP_ID=MMETSP0434-20130131/3252_1 /TAXON_ID=626734 ORGANISM="Favella taraikaensis, Strain Fe Narragansett Bay" /NCGR_SAMPLE_ID=MMETSP0434 /ASSEMBLY_ACC=CAM_ASM_000379 /LENGTH=224 /DNA_ID=CAMNT_0028186491 /DNA_START=8 /DNA_END=681 /DNA_ORIENTATION=-